MSVFSRTILAGLTCASLLGAQAAFAAPAPDGGPDPHTAGRAAHASKCLLTLGFGGGCDKDAPVTKEEREAAKAEHQAKVTKVSNDTGTRRQFQHAAKCVGTLGFGGGCDKKEPYGTAENKRVSEDAAPDTSTRGQFFHAATCVGSLGFAGNCDKK